MLMRHAWEVHAADQMIDAECLLESLNRGNALLWTSDDEAVVTQLLQPIDRRVVLCPDQRMRPATAVFIAIVHQQVLLSQLARLFGGLGDHHLTRERPGK